MAVLIGQWRGFHFTVMSSGGHSCVTAESPPGHEDGSRPLCDDSSGSFGFQVALELRAEASGDKLMADPGSDQDLSS